MNQNLSDPPKNWLGKRYYSLDAYCKAVYQEKLYKIAIDAGCTCPNRDGTIDTRGCIFCSAGGSGDFAVLRKNHPTIREQIEIGQSLFRNKNIGTGLIAYFQAYSNTYGDPAHLKAIYEEALSHPDIRGISIATRPDCVSPEILQILSALKEQFLDKFIWVELGLQTMHRKTADFIRRGYELKVFEEAVTNLVNIQIPLIIHLILGLPGETKDDFLGTIGYLNTFFENVRSSCPQWHENQFFGVKLQLLHVLKGTDLAEYYADQYFDTLSLDAYLDWLIAGLENLSPEIIIHRLTGDGPKDLLIAPLWSLNKRNVLNSIAHELKARDTWQGKEYHGCTHHGSI